MLTVSNISKSYGKKDVVREVSFEVARGEAFGLLGPNGAGKSTLIGMISGLLEPNAGEITVNGVSVLKKPLDVKRKIGVVPQEIALYPTMTARENLLFWGQMQGLTRKQATKRMHEVLDLVGLQERAKEKVETFSGGMKRRINIAAALMHEPELLIMDEPTVGIDPQSRNHILDTVKHLNEEGMTVIYTSHYMEEVEQLCKRIGIVDNGSFIALGTKQDLIERLSGGTAIQVKFDRFIADWLSELEQLPGVVEVIKPSEDPAIEIYDDRQGAVVGDVLTWANKKLVKVQSLEVKEPNLETLFLSLTGRSLRD